MLPLTLPIMFSYAKFMDGISPTPQPPKKRAGIIVVGIIVVILLIPILLALNYFNIFPLSQLFPNQLGFLPQRSQPTPSPLPDSTPTQDYTASTFQYDTGKAHGIITQYLKDTIKPEFLPENLEIKQGLSIDNRTEDIKYQFGSYYTKGQATISANFLYKENTNIPNGYLIFIEPANVEGTIVTQAIVNSLTSTYFNDPFSPIENCVIEDTISYCENFKIETDGKRGYGVVFGEDISVSPPKFTPFVFTCYFPKESRIYDSSQSCISFK